MASQKLGRLTTIAALALLLAGPLIAAEHPNMVGTWLVDAASSDFGPMPSPTDLVLDITSSGDDFQVVQTGGGQPDLTLRFNTAGREVTNELPGGGKMTSAHRWEKDALLGDIKIVTPDGAQMTFKDRITYSPDGRTMTQQRTMSGSMGESQLKIVANRK